MAASAVTRVQRITRCASGSPLATPCRKSKEPNSQPLSATAPLAAIEPTATVRRKSRRVGWVMVDVCV